MPRDRDILLAKKPAQRRALTSPLRVELLEHFRAAGQASVREIAARMQRPPDGLYYHVRLLERVGLLRQASSRKRGKRDEAIYRIPARQIALPCDTTSAKSINTTMQAIGAAFRLAEREARTALENQALTAEGDRRDFFMRRVRVRLSHKALAEINEHIDAIERLAVGELQQQHAADDTRACSITLALIGQPEHTDAAD